MFRIACVSMCGFIYATIYKPEHAPLVLKIPVSKFFTVLQWMAKDVTGKQREGRGMKRDRKQGWESKRERGRLAKKLKETDVENHLGMGECGR